MDRGSAAGPEQSVTLALSRVPARGERTGTLLVNPGGPGSSGRGWASIVALGLPDDLRDRYDVVAFDPRGVGASTPALTCDPGHFDPVRPDTVPHDAADEDALLDRAADYARSCRAANGDLLEHATTVDSAHDMDAIRAALGVERIDYLGYSYGSYLGAVYATLYPDRVGRLVLDSIVDPDRGWYEGNLAQSRSLDAATGHFFDWIARHDDVYGLGATGDEVAKHYYEVREGLAERPEQAVGPTEYEGTYLVAAYAAAYWPPLARALADQVNDDDPAALIAAYERFGESAEDEPAYAAYLATECTDSVWPRSWTTWRADGREVHAEAPFLGWNNIWYNAPCMFWPVQGGPWFQVDGSEVSDALLVQATDDGPTPLHGAYAMRERFPGSRLVIEDGGVTHGVSLSGNTCVDDAVADYLRTGELPEAGGGADGADLTCPAPPEPEPHRAQTAPAPEARP
nr:alpha/beta hydrolase [Spinactinospora alkalitolerans]